MTWVPRFRCCRKSAPSIGGVSTENKDGIAFCGSMTVCGTPFATLTHATTIAVPVSCRCRARAFQVTLAHAHEANQRIVEQLNDQVDFLNRQLANREAELSEVKAGFGCS